MRTIQGVSVSAGIAIGTVRVLAAVDYAVERRLIAVSYTHLTLPTSDLV